MAQRPIASWWTKGMTDGGYKSFHSPGVVTTTSWAERPEERKATAETQHWAFCMDCYSVHIC